MRSTRQAAIIFGLILALLVPSWNIASAQSSDAQNEQWQRYIIQLATGIPVDDLIAQKLDSRSSRVLQKYSTVINGFAVELPPRAAEALAKDPRIVNVMADPVVQIDAQTIPTGIQRIGTLSNSQARIDGTDERVNLNVAVIDTGSGPHADLNVVGGIDCTGSGTYNDQNGHGTHVAGTIGALDNATGVVGVAPGARIWSVKVLDANGSGYGSWILCGIDWVTKNLSTTSIKVANMSLGGVASVADDGNCGLTQRDSIHQAICNSVAAGVTYTVAAGNDGKNASTYFPAMYDEVITVSALVDTDGKAGGVGPSTSVGADDTLASFSNYGADVDVIAPGVNILSTVPGGGYANYSGTSMASPHAAGAAALYLAANPGALPAQVRSALTSSGSPSGWSGDRDSTKEPLINVASSDDSNPPAEEPEPDPLPATIDAEVVSISAPSSVTKGGSVTISTNVRNNGLLSGTVNVTFNESPGGASQTKSVSLGAGASTTVSFSWATSSTTATGTHTLTATASVTADTNTGNNAKSRTITVTAPTTKSMYVSNIQLSSSRTSTGARISTRVYIKSGSAVMGGARVTIRYTDPNGATLSSSATTNRYGYALFSRSVTRKGTYSVQVTGVTKSGYSYTPSSNVVTKKSTTIG